MIFVINCISPMRLLFFLNEGSMEQAWPGSSFSFFGSHFSIS